MKHSILFCALTFGSLFPLAASADTMGGMKMEAIGGMGSMPKKTVIAQGVGVINAINAKQGQITLAHDPIPALKWPAMSMGFKVADPQLLKGLTIGKKVQFTLQDNGMEQVITVISASR